MKGKTTGEEIYARVRYIIDLMNLNLAKLTSVTTDGAPAMIGPHQGFVARMKQNCPHMLNYHCIIHQSVLCAKMGQ